MREKAKDYAKLTLIATAMLSAILYLAKLGAQRDAAVYAHKARCQRACESVGLEVYECTEYGDKLYGVECSPKGGE